VEMKLDRMERETVGVGVILAVLFEPCRFQLRRPWQQRKVFHRGLQIAKSLRGTDAGKGTRGRHFARQQAFVPDAGKVRTPIRRARRGREHVHAAIRVPRRRGGLD